MNNGLAFGLALLLTAGQLAGTGSPASRVPVRSPATPETAFVVLRWNAAFDARGGAVQRYLWRVVAGSTLLAADSTTLLSDTVKVPRPLPGDSLILQAMVAARDKRDNLSGWTSSNKIIIPGRPWVPPLPPTGVTLDTLALSPPDSVKLIVESGARIDSLGRTVVFQDSSFEVCAYAYRMGQRQTARTVTGWSVNNPGISDTGLGSTPWCRRFAVSPTAEIG